MSSRPALGPTQPPIQWVPGATSPGVKLTTHLELVPRSRKRGSIHPLPHTSSRRSASLVKHKDNFTFLASYPVVLGSHSRRCSGQGVKVTANLHLMRGLIMPGTVTPLPPTSSWRGLPSVYDYLLWGEYSHAFVINFPLLYLGWPSPRPFPSRCLCWLL
jgi:hypothetical protein